MLVIDKSNQYSFANTVVKVIDNTTQVDDITANTTPIPKFSILIPTVQAVGVTNTMELYQPGEIARYLSNHGDPNSAKYGFGPDFIHAILSKSGSDVGVYTVNLRGASATNANMIVLMKYKVEPNVAYKDSEGRQYYVQDGQMTVTPAPGATPVKRDVMHVKFVETSVEGCKSWVDVHKAMNDLTTDTPDTDGYKTVAWFGTMYRGAGAYGNNLYYNMIPGVSEFDGSMYYTLNLYNGRRMITTDSTFSMDPAAGAKYATTYYMENRFNDTFSDARYMTAESAEALIELFNKYLFTTDDFIKDPVATPKSSVTFDKIDAFTVDTFGIQLDEGSLNSQVTNAFVLANGTEGEETADQLFKDFFDGKIIEDISSVLRYRFPYIIDTGYDDDTKQAIIGLVNKRNHMTTATIMVGDNSTFNSAIIDHSTNYYDNMPNIRQLAKVQSPMKYNEFTRRTVVYPCTYFDMIAMLDHFIKWGNYYQPFAGAECRWTGYIEDTMKYAAETVDYMESLNKARVNIVMKDSNDGAYLADQLMNTVLTSDQTEFNNAFLISEMLYDLINLVHYNHFKFNEAEEVRQFQTSVDDCINANYKEFSASVSVDVYRMGTVGRAKSKNKIAVTIDLKDINKWTDIDIILTDD